MVLITDSRDGGGSSPRKVKPTKYTASIGNSAQIYPTIVEEPPDRGNDVDDEYLGSYESDVYDEDEFEELEDFSELPDTRSIASDDSFYPPDFADSKRTPSPESPPTLPLFQACCSNNALTVKFKIRQGVTEEEVQETDKNKRTGLIVACYQGYVDVVIALSQCPYVDVNWQDNEGNTALIIAAQVTSQSVTTYSTTFPGLILRKGTAMGSPL